MTRIIVPNLHVILIHFPLGLLGLGVLIEVFSFLWRRTGLHQAARWMILLGALGLLPAGTSGIYAMLDVMNQGRDGTDAWAQLKSDSGFTAQDWEQAKDHLLFSGVGTGLALVAVVGWMGASDKGRRWLYPFSLLALLAAMGLITLGAWHGGEMVFRHGFGVEGVKGVLQADSLADHASWRDKVDGTVSLIQLHLVAAGLVFAAAVGALGCALRRATAADAALGGRPVQQAADVLAAAPPALVEERSQELPLAAWQPPRRPQRPNSPLPPLPAPMPSARLWLLATVLAIATAAVGLWSAALLLWPGIADWDSLKTAIHKIATPDERRMGLHIIFGAAIVVLGLLLALVARWAPRGRVVLSFLALPLVLLMAAQTYSGVLILYDGDGGPLTQFKAKPLAEPPGSIPAVTVPAAVPATQATTLPR